MVLSVVAAEWHTQMTKITINRAPVLSLWSFVVARRLGHSHDSALSLAKAITGMSAYAKAKSLGLVEERDTDVSKRTKAREQNQKFIVFMGRRIPVANSPSGPLALKDGKPIQPLSAEKYITSKFGESRGAVYAAMVKLARSRPPAKLAKEAFHLYEEFRPSISAGVAGWGEPGVLDLDKIERLAEAAN
jgi:hypothetical protein